MFLNNITPFAERWIIRFILLLLPVAWTASIFLFSTDMFSSRETGDVLIPLLKFFLNGLVTNEGIELIHTIIRKAAHMVEYAMLNLLWYFALNLSLRKWNTPISLTSFFISSLCAVADEYHQTTTFEREGSMGDVLFDMTGMLISMIIIKLNIRLDGRSALGTKKKILNLP